MPIYTFDLRDGTNGIEDSIGVSLDDHDAALDYARAVVQELMRCREKQTRFWRLDVYDGERRLLFKLPFASMDPTLAHLAPEVRGLVADLCERQRSLRETMYAVNVTVRESQALVARSRGKPYLATERGEHVIRST